MGLYNVEKARFAKLEMVSFDDENMREQDLQARLIQDISVISENLLVISDEFGNWADSKRRIDILALDKAANLVVIELKRTEDGGHMELQAIRYAAMVANMTWAHAEAAFAKFIERYALDIDAREKLCKFLGWDEPREDDFAQNVRIILVSADFSKEITTAVLWLNERDLDITCVRLSLYKLDNQQLVMNAEQIIPLPETADYQVQVREKKQAERTAKSQGRDYSRYSISYEGAEPKEPFKKADIGYMTIKLLEQQNLIDEKVFQFLRKDKSSNFQLLKKLDEMSDVEKQYKKYRHDDEPELVYKGEGYYVVRNWGVDNIGSFIEKIENKFPSIKYEKIEKG